MIFNSIEFILFFLVVTALYFALPHTYRWRLLLISSCYFYMAFVPIYILILFFTIVIDYYAGIYLEESKGQHRKWFLVASLIANIGVLCFFKYYNFFHENVTVLLQSAGLKNPAPLLTILLPIGLSFHTFQAMSYTIEVYRGNQKAERHFGIYALYVMFYPQLVAGPIERPQNILYQFYEKHNWDYDRVTKGLTRMLWGFFKKLVIADRLSLYVDAVYSHPENHSGITLLVSTIFFAFQIYCDFSGYSDIAIGAAKVMGFRLMENFRRPYFAKSVSEFWSRWHISLSTWFRDYLYIPLGGSRVSVPRWYANLFIVFLISGLWHGPNWTYVIWGALNGLYLVGELGIDRLYPRAKQVVPRYIRNPLRVVMTFVLIAFSWIFFRAADLNTAFHIVHKMVTNVGSLYTDSPAYFIYSLVGIAILLIIEARQELSSKFSLVNNRSLLVRASVYAMVVIYILLFGVFDGGQFIYFQF